MKGIRKCLATIFSYIENYVLSVVCKCVPYRAVCLSFALCCILAINCCTVLDYHPYDAHITGETNLTAKNIAAIEETLAGKNSFRFAVISDTQRWYDETSKAVDAINRLNNIDFVLHCGDQTDWGLTDEFLLMRDILGKLKVPWLCIMGNHDYIGTGDYCYDTIYGARNFSFTAGDIKFICVNTNWKEENTLPDFNFMESEKKNLGEDIKRTIVAMHVKPFTYEFNNALANVFQSTIKGFPNLQFCINGHHHLNEVCDLFGDGVLYYGIPSINNREIILFTINEEGYEYETMEF